MSFDKGCQRRFGIQRWIPESIQRNDIDAFGLQQIVSNHPITYNVGSPQPPQYDVHQRPNTSTLHPRGEQTQP